MIETSTHQPIERIPPKNRNLRGHYESKGYVVVPELVSGDLIDNLLSCYQNEIVSSSEPFYRQSSSRYEKNAFTPSGFVAQSFLDIHDFSNYRGFTEAAKRVFFEKRIRGALSEITGHPEHNLMQTMLFDANTETVPHQDWWYLDTVPNGYLIAAWIALEDIDEKAGRFFVMPETHKVNLIREGEKGLAHSEWLARIAEYFKSHPKGVAAPALKKGDVVFWNSRTIHGSLPTQDSSLSRKSLTAHYIPSSYRFGNLFVEKNFVKYKTYDGMKYYRNQPGYSLYQKLKNGIKLAVYDSPAAIRNFRKIQKWLRNL